MPRYTDVDALLKDITHRYCENCDRHKGIKNGKKKVIYDIGEAPCKACGIGDMRDELDDAPIADAVEVIRCKDCRYMTEHYDTDGNVPYWTCSEWDGGTDYDGYCHFGERKEDD